MTSFASKFVQRQRAAREYNDYFRRKIGVGRASMRAGRGRSNEDVEAAFAARRSAANSG